MKSEFDKKSNKHNNNITSKILELYRSGELVKSLEFIKQYNLKYPKDIKGKYIEGKLLRINGNPELAKEVLDIIFPTVPITSEFYYKIIIELLFIEIDLENYESALNYLTLYQSIDLPQELEYVDIPLTRIFLLKKLGKFNQLIPLRYYNHNERQVISFSKEECLNNIIKHTKPTEFSNEYFYANIDYLALYERLERLLPYATKYIGYSVLDYYIFHLFPIGRDEQGEISYIRLSTIEEDGQIKIIRMCPFRPNCSKRFINQLNEIELKYFLDDASLVRKR